MSHLEDLEEYDAELELTLKREYATVFGLFRYCVLTQEATYLCNKLDMKIEHQPSYPLFHLRMEDVWVWDKNRPSRIIPLAEEVHTYPIFWQTYTMSAKPNEGAQKGDDSIAARRCPRPSAGSCRRRRPPCCWAL